MSAAMSTVRFVLRESFVPHTLVLAALIGLTAWLDGEAAVWARRETVIVVTPQELGWDEAQLQEDGIVASSQGAVGDPTLDSPELAEARRLSRANDHKAALAVAERVVDTLATAPAWNEVGVFRLRAGNPRGARDAFDKALAIDGGYQRAHYNRALARGREGDVEGARADYLAVLALTPRDFAATYNLGLLELSAGATARAKELFQAATELGGNDAKAAALCALGLAYSRSGNRKAALVVYERSIEFRPSYLLPRYNQAALLFKSAERLDRQRAGLVLEQLVALAPDFAPAHFLRGRLSSTDGDRQAAMTHYERAAQMDRRFFKAHYNFALAALELDRVSDAKATFERLTREFPDRPEPHFNLGRIAYREERHLEAVQAYERALALARTASPQGSYPDARLNLALALDALGRFDDALRELALVESDPTLGPAAIMNQGLVKKHQGDLVEARERFEAAIARRPGYSAALYNLGKLAAEADDHAAAAAAYAKVLEVDPKNLKAAVNLGVERAAQGDHTGAIAAYRSALKLQPNHPPALFNLALAQRETNNLAGAAETYRRLLAVDEDNVKAWQNLAVVYARQERPDLAVEVLGEALDREPSSAALRFNLALQFQKLGRTEAARNELERVLRLEPRHEKAALTLARQHRDAGRLDEAAAVLAPLTGEERPSSRALVVLARVHLASRRTADAVAALLRALDRAPTSLQALSLLVSHGPADAARERLHAASTKKPLDPNWARLGARLAPGAPQ